MVTACFVSPWNHVRDGPQIVELLLPGHAVRVLPRRITASSLLPVTDEEVLFQIQQALKLWHFVQQRQGRAALHDEERRKTLACRADADSLAGAVDIQRDGFIDGQQYFRRHIPCVPV
jgi:hypothetical protein